MYVVHGSEESHQRYLWGNKLVVDHQFTDLPMFGLLQEVVEQEKDGRSKRRRRCRHSKRQKTSEDGGGVNTLPGRVLRLFYK
jgi:hypothetical protein